jgi:NADH-quinone oxidoreductase subunit H
VISQVQLIVSMVMGVTMLGGLMAVGGLYTFYERKVAAWTQNRYGPNRVGPKGYLQFMADGTKFFTKEDVIPSYVDKPIFLLAPLLIMVPALILYSAIPIGMSFTWDGELIDLKIADLGLGVLYVLAVAGMSVYGIVLGAWSSNSKYPLFGGLRASAQMISYELAMGLSIVTVVLIAGGSGTNSLNLSHIIGHQTEYWFGIIPKWNVFANPLAFFIFLVCTYAETNRLPFDFAEAEQELVGGYHTEYSSMKFAMFMLSEYVNMITMSMLVVVLFFGGWHFPGIELIEPMWLAVITSVLAFAVKTLFFMFLFLWVRWTLPRMRYDTLMRLSWKVLLPVALANVLVTAVWLAIW